MLKAIQCDTHEHAFRHVSTIEQAREVKNDPHTILWLDLQSPTQEELARLGKEFQLHPLAIEDASHEHQRPKVEEYESFFLVVFYALNTGSNQQGLDICEIDMFLGENYLITVHNGPVHELDEVEQRWRRNVK